MEKPYQLLQPVFKDHRGSFTPIKLSDKWVQSNISINDDIFVFRGLHYQEGETAQTKLVSVIQGKIIDFVVNLDKESEDFGNLETFVLTSGESVYVPKGYAHGFLTLQSGTIVSYLVDNEYSKEHEGCIQWDTIEEVKEIISKYMRGFNFKMKISDKDTEGISLEQYKNK